jgi:hypothetical protein
MQYIHNHDTEIKRREKVQVHCIDEPRGMETAGNGVVPHRETSLRQSRDATFLHARLWKVTARCQKHCISLAEMHQFKLHNASQFSVS